MSLYQLNLMDVLEIKMSKDYLEAMKLCGILKAELDTGMKNVIGGVQYAERVLAEQGLERPLREEVAENAKRFPKLYGGKDY